MATVSTQKFHFSAHVNWNVVKKSNQTQVLYASFPINSANLAIRNLTDQKFEIPFNKIPGIILEVGAYFLLGLNSVGTNS